MIYDFYIHFDIFPSILSLKLAFPLVIYCIWSCVRVMHFILHSEVTLIQLCVTEEQKVPILDI